MLLQLFFWISLSLIGYTYVVYPLFVLVLSLSKKKSFIEEKQFDFPTVSVVVSVYNEEQIIAEKLKNCARTDYPENKIEFLFGSDGSSDRTNSIVQKVIDENHSHIVRLFAFSNRRGKASVLNEIVPKANGDIVVFSDGNTMFESNTIKKLVQHFRDKNVGAVCGELVLIADSKTAGGSGEFSYWSYENNLKKLESHVQTIIGATGAVYAIRKHLYTLLPISKTIMDDFLIPLEIVKKGFSVKYEPEAFAFEKSSDSIQGEFKRKVRIGAANFHGISNIKQLLHPRYGFVAFALWSHKIFRWCVPFLLMFIFLTSLPLSVHSELYRNILYGELAFLFLGFIGFIMERLKINISFLSLPYYFLAMNTALFVGFLKFLFNKQRPTWEVIR